jgi:hypothetical protein
VCRCECRVPLNSIRVDTYGTLEAEWTDEKLIALINYNFDLRYV